MHISIDERGERSGPAFSGRYRVEPVPLRAHWHTRLRSTPVDGHAAAVSRLDTGSMKGGQQGTRVSSASFCELCLVEPSFAVRLDRHLRTPQKVERRTNFAGCADSGAEGTPASPEIAWFICVKEDRNRSLLNGSFRASDGPLEKGSRAGGFQGRLTARQRNRDEMLRRRPSANIKRISPTGGTSLSSDCGSERQKTFTTHSQVHGESK